jgi:hypothetical protein
VQGCQRRTAHSLKTGSQSEKAAGGHAREIAGAGTGVVAGVGGRRVGRLGHRNGKHDARRDAVFGAQEIAGGPMGAGEQASGYAGGFKGGRKRKGKQERVNGVPGVAAQGSKMVKVHKVETNKTGVGDGVGESDGGLEAFASSHPCPPPYPPPCPVTSVAGSEVWCDSRTGSGGVESAGEGRAKTLEQEQGNALVFGSLHSLIQAGSRLKAEPEQATDASPLVRVRFTYTQIHSHTHTHARTHTHTHTHMGLLYPHMCRLWIRMG